MFIKCRVWLGNSTSRQNGRLPTSTASWLLACKPQSTQRILLLPPPSSFLSISLTCLELRSEQNSFSSQDSIALVNLFKMLKECRHRRLENFSGREILRDPQLEKMLRLFAHASSKRYIAQRRCRRRPLNKFAIDLKPKPADPDDLQPWLNEIELINAYRMTRKALRLLASEIKDHEVFQRGQRGPVHILLNISSWLFCISELNGG